MIIKRLYGICLLLLLYNINLFGQQPKLVLPFVHSNTIYSTKFSPNGKLIVTSSADFTSKIWDVATGKMLSTLAGHLRGVTYSEFSPDGKKVVSSSQDRTAKIWDVASGSLLFNLTGHLKGINSVQFSADGKMIATSSDDSTAKVWDALTGRLLFKLKGHYAAINSAYFNSGANKIVTSSADLSTRVWDAQTGDLLLLLTGHKGEVTSARFSPDGKTIITSSKDHTAKLWDAETGALLFELTGHNKQVNSALFSPDGKKIITTSSDSTAKLWDSFGRLIHTFKIQEPEILFAQFSLDSKKLTTAARYSAQIWDLQNGKLISDLESQSGYASFSPDSKKVLTLSGKIFDAATGKFLGGISGWVSPWIYSIDFSPDVQKMALIYEQRHLKIRNVNDGNLLVDLTAKGKLLFSTNELINSSCKIKFSADSKKFATANNAKAVRIWEIGSGKLIAELGGHISNVSFVQFSHDGNRIITADTYNSRVWDIRTGNLICKAVHSEKISTAIFSSDDKKIITALWNGTFELLDATNGKNLLTFEGYRPQFSSDGSRIICASQENTIRLWDSNTGKLLYESQKYEGRFNQFSPDGKKFITVLSGEMAKVDTAKLWDVATGTSIATLEGLVIYPYSSQFSPDSRKFIAASDHNSTKIWDANTGSLIEDLKGHTNIIMSARFSADAKKVFSTSGDGLSKVWDTENGKLLYTFAEINNNEYFIQTARGYYKRNKESARLLYYITKDLKIIGFEQLDVKYNRPDKVLEAIGNTDTALIKSYRKAWEKRIKKLGIDTTSFREGYSVPEADFTNRDVIEYEQKTGILKLLIKGNDSTYKLDRFNVWVNETPIFGQRGINIRKRDKNDFDTTITIKLSQEENRIETSITNVNGTESYRMPLTVNYSPAVKQKESVRFIGIGIDQFAESQYNLQYSAKDIRDLSKKLKEKYKDDIIIDTLFNENVTTSNVKALKQKLLQTTENDKVIVAYSGHGMLSKEYDYYLSTYAVNFENPEQNGLPYDELENLLDSIPARKKLMLIDACHSGEVDKEDLITLTASSDSLIKGFKPVVYKKDEKHLGLKNSFELMQSLFVNVGKSTGAIIISAAAGTQFALERNDLKNGVFTYSILEAMNKYPTMKIGELKKTVGERVEQLTKGLQKPTSRNETIAVDWNLW